MLTHLRAKKYVDRNLKERCFEGIFSAIIRREIENNNLLGVNR